MLRAAVVFLQHDSPERWEVPSQPGQVAAVGTAKRVNRLVLIAHHEQALQRIRIGGQQLHQFVLDPVGVLEFVDQNVRPTGTVPVQHIPVAAKQPQRMQQEIVEVQGVVGPQGLLIVRIDWG